MPLPDFLAALAHAPAAVHVLSDPDTLAIYACDETPKRCTPRAVAFPRAHAEVLELVRLANAYRIPLVARGAGSGNVGGALPAPDSVVVSFECMDAILEFDPDNRLMVVEAGVVTERIEQTARSRGLMYPPDPGSAPYCRIGGNLAMNAAGPRAVKYGTTRDYVLGLRAVTGAGAEIRTGCRTTKGVTGYDLTRLLVGSEGTLALITEATLRLIPAPRALITLRACYNSNDAALAACARVMTQPVIPCALEFMDRLSIEAVRSQLPDHGLPQGTQALLIIEADGETHDLPRQIAALTNTLTDSGLIELREAHDAEETRTLWRARKSLSHAVKQIAPLKINEDIVVPIMRLSEMVAFLEAQARGYQLPIVSFGHAGNGNLHVNLMVRPDDAREMARARACLLEIFEKTLALGGTLSGEHGIGTEKREFLPLEIAPPALDLMRGLKALFDPNGILNPGKLLPETG
jgi:D-lactate dehydrogenase